MRSSPFPCLAARNETLAVAPRFTTPLPQREPICAQRYWRRGVDAPPGGTWPFRACERTPLWLPPQLLNAPSTGLLLPANVPVRLGRFLLLPARALGRRVRHCLPWAHDATPLGAAKRRPQVSSA